MKPIARTIGQAIAALALAVLTSVVYAVDVDPIVIKSRFGEPLYAEIPIKASSPADIAKVKAQLASATTFARTGLPRPQGIVANLHFAVGHDAGGKPIIQVTSDMPLQEEFVTFLIEVDWEEGRLIREYSISAPRGAAPPAADPLIQDAMAQAPFQAAQPQMIPLADPASADPQSVDLPPPVQPAVAAAAPPQMVQSDAIPVIDRRRPATVQSAPANNSAAPARAFSNQPAASRSAAAVPAQRPTQHTAPEAVRRPAAAPISIPAQAPQQVASVPAPVVPAQSSYGPVKAGENLSSIADKIRGEFSQDQAMLAMVRVNPSAFIGGNINGLHRGAVLRVPVNAEMGRFTSAEAEQMVRDQIQQWRTGQPTTPQPAALAEAVHTPAPAQPQGARLTLSPVATAIQLPTRNDAGNGDDAVQAGTSQAVSAAGSDAAQAGEGQGQENGSTPALSEVEALKSRVAELERQSKSDAGSAAVALKQDQIQGGSNIPWGWILAMIFVLALVLVWLLSRKMFAMPKPQTAQKNRYLPDQATSSPRAEQAVATATLTDELPAWHSSTFSLAETDTPDQKRLAIARACMSVGDYVNARAILREIADGTDTAASEAARLLLGKMQNDT